MLNFTSDNAIVSTIALLLMTLTGCAGSPVALGKLTPEQLAKESNHNLCRAAFSNYATTAIDNEVKNRQINCAPYVEEDARSSANANATAAAYQNSLERNQPVTTNCTTYGTGVEKNMRTAVGWYKRAADLGMSGAKMKAVMLERGL